MQRNASELAWAAGFFDGEGGTYFRPPEKTRGGWGTGQVMTKVSQVDREVLDRFHAAVGGYGKVNGPYPSKRGFRAVYRWEAGAMDEVNEVIWALWPYLSDVKRKQALAALEAKEERVLEHAGWGRSPVTGRFVRGGQ